MNQEISSHIGNLDKKIHPEQFDQVVEAILAGKYSWACVLMLRFVGYNPMHYIPYRTYNRLLKENSRERKTSSQVNENTTEQRSDNHLTSNCLSKIKDLPYLEVGNQAKAVVSANNREEWLTQRNSQPQATKSSKRKGNTQDIPVQVCEFI
ncbi:MAG TPA: HetP family heterocyst commitment protein [Nostocaceae cyanobacterium]|nr:HetP family heterocyst commitment protein [Nostocaceae cyanobacterium]